MTLTQEQKRGICEEYKDRSKKVEEISKKYGILRGDVAHIAVEMGAEPRNHKRYGKNLPRKGGAAARACPKCRKTIDVKGAKFCYFCGADIRSNKELLIERVNKAMCVTRFLPESERDTMQQLFLEIKKELSKEV